MQRSKNDVWVGLFVLLGAAAILFLALKSANLLSMNFQTTYNVTARFDNVGGLKRQAAVKSAGVVVGRVDSVSFDDKTFQASMVSHSSSKSKRKIIKASFNSIFDIHSYTHPFMLDLQVFYLMLSLLSIIETI